MSKVKVKYLSYDNFENAISEFYGDKNHKADTALKAAREIIGGEDFYILRRPDKKVKNEDSAFCKFKKALEDIDEGGLIYFLCEKYPGYRVKIKKGKKSIADIISLTPGDDLRVSNALEKQLREEVGDKDFPLAKEELLRLYPILVDDESGRLRKLAKDLVVVDVHISQMSRIMMKNFAEDVIPSKSEWDQLKDLRRSRNDILKILGLTDDQLKKNRADGNVGLARAAEMLQEKSAEEIATSDLLGQIKKLEGEKIEKDILKETDEREVDSIDRKWISEPASEMNG